MPRFTNSELADMHYTYGLADGNALMARRIYQERYPNRIIPDARMFSRIHIRLHETGSLSIDNSSKGAHSTMRTPELEEAVLNTVEEHPETSTRKIAVMLNVSHFLIWKIIVDNLLYPFHIQRVQALLPRDFPSRLNFCRWFLEKLAEDPLFKSKILFTDEANFSRNSIRNFHNNHVWAEENPHAITEAHHQEQFSVNVWAGIVGDFLIGPFFLPGRLDGLSYRHFLENDLPILLEDVPLLFREEMWYMHDGAPAHFSIRAREFLNEAFTNRWIGRGGTQSWPPRSPDLNSLDYFFWGHLKTLVYTTPIQTVEELRQKILLSCQTIRNTPGIFERVRQSMRKRIEACILAEGGHFQQFL